MGHSACLAARAVATAGAALALACGGASAPSAGPEAPAGPAAPATADPGPGTPAVVPGWTVVAAEDFEALDLGAPGWSPDPVPDDGPFSDAGRWFTDRGIRPPAAYRISHAFGRSGWLTAESYTRTPATTPFAALAAIVPDPAGGPNHVLRIASPAHTDATVIRSTSPLPDTYRVSLRMGFASFGDGKPGLNGYAGGETAEPWWPDPASSQNGFYWLAILDAPPRPHNNTWIHHHRKVVMDSDNHDPPWMEIFDGQRFVPSGEHPVQLFAIDGRSTGTERTGKDFIPYAGGSWQPSGTIRAADAYLPGEWYRVAIERKDGIFTLEISGRFRYGGQTTYRGSVDAAAACVWHFNRTAAESAPKCVDERTYPSLGPGFPYWPAGQVWPDFFMFGDPHVNYYRGEVYVDDVKLETWR